MGSPDAYHGFSKSGQLLQNVMGTAVKQGSLFIRIAYFFFSTQFTPGRDAPTTAEKMVNSI